MCSVHLSIYALKCLNAIWYIEYNVSQNTRRRLKTVIICCVAIPHSAMPGHPMFAQCIAYQYSWLGTNIAFLFIAIEIPCFSCRKMRQCIYVSSICIQWITVYSIMNDNNFNNACLSLTENSSASNNRLEKYWTTNKIVKFMYAVLCACHISAYRSRCH